MTDTNSLPDDPVLLKEMLLELMKQLQRSRDNEEQLRARLDELLRRLYGRSAEKVDPNQLALIDLEALGAPPAKVEEEPVEEPTPAPKPKRRPKRSRPSKELPRVRVEHTLPDAERLCPCCQVPMPEIRTETHEQLDYKPASLFVVEHVHSVYGCRNGCDEKVERAPKPPQLVEKGLPGPGLLAYISISKWCDHLPYYRLDGIFRRQGVSIPRSTQCGWTKAVEESVRPLLEWMRQDICRGTIIQSDDTTVPVQAPGTGKTRTGYLWVYVGDEDHPWVLYDYTPGRGRDGPDLFLKEFSKGYLQADGSAAYTNVYQRPGIIQVGCWMHARRYFWQALEQKDSRALEAVAMVRQLYKIESRCAGFSPDRRRDVRQEEAVPVLKAFHDWIDKIQPGVQPKCKLGEALTYARNQWPALERYTQDGRLSIDNGESERQMRGIALGRKNWLFAGSDAGGTRAGALNSIIRTAIRHGVDLFAYLRDLFELLPGWPEARIHELTPLAWAQRQAESSRLDIAS